MNSAIRRSDYRGGRAEENRRRSPVSTPAASPKAALHAYAAEGGGSFAAPLGHALSVAQIEEARAASAGKG